MRLIDADCLLNAIEKLKVRNTSNNATIFDVLGVLDDVEKIIKAAPINEPVKHGQWEESKCLDDCFWVCSCCKFPSTAVAAPKLYKYCPNCGAKMDAQFGDSGL